MFLILIVGLALFAFVLDPSSIQSFFSSNKVNSIGQINGEEIDREAFALEVENYKTQSGGRASQMQAVNAVWSTTLGEKIFESQLKAAGIVIGEKDIWNSLIALPEIQNSPLFKNEANLFDEEKLKEYISNLKDEAEVGDKQIWANWLATEKEIKRNLERQTYTNLVSAGLGASLKEGERDYIFSSTKINADYVFVPYSSVSDSLAKISKKEIQKYIEGNSKKFKPEATRSLQYVIFNIAPSEKDELEVKKEVSIFINDREEYSNAAKTTISVPGLKNATAYEAFLNDNKSDLGIDNGYKSKNNFSPSVADVIFNTATGDVVGPYKDNGFYKVSKVVEITQIPDSVKSSHILVPYSGAVRSTSLKTKEAAKFTADSIFAIVKNNKEKYAEVANEINTDGTKGVGGDIGWVVRDQAFSASFDKDFANFIYKNNTGSINVVETAFGFHVIRIDEQKKKDNVVKLVSFARAIEASEETENIIFENAETLASKLTDGKSISALAQEKGYEVLSALNLKALDEAIPSLNNQRQIVTWSFEQDRKVGDFKRFDVEINGKRGYVVAIVSGKTEKDGIVLSVDVLEKIRPELINKKKAKLIKEKMKGATLEEIAKNSKVTVATAQDLSLTNPLIAAIGMEPGVVGGMSTIKIGKVSSVIEGETGVFVMVVKDRKLPIKLDNYENYRKKINQNLKSRSYQLFQVLEDAADVKDFRSTYY